MIHQKLKRVAKIEATMQIGLLASALPSREDRAVMNHEEAARCYFEFVNAPMSPATSAASRASIAGISPAQAAETYERVMRATA